MSYELRFLVCSDNAPWSSGGLTNTDDFAYALRFAIEAMREGVATNPYIVSGDSQLAGPKDIKLTSDRLGDLDRIDDQTLLGYFQRAWKQTYKPEVTCRCFHESHDKDKSRGWIDCVGKCGFNMMFHCGYHRVEKDGEGNVVSMKTWCPQCYNPSASEQVSI